jgi:hypothetical protein
MVPAPSFRLASVAEGEVERGLAPAVTVTIESASGGRKVVKVMAVGGG